MRDVLAHHYFVSRPPARTGAGGDLLHAHGGSRRAHQTEGRQLAHPPDLACSTPDFDIRVSDHKAEFSPRAHFADPEPVRVLAQSTIDAWELH